MEASLSKLCADHLRAYVTTNEKFKASHACELVAAYFGYKSHAAQLAEEHHPLSALEEASTLIPDVELMEKRREDLSGLPRDLPSCMDLAKIISAFLKEEWGFPGDIWIYHSLEGCIIEEMLTGLENHEDVVWAMSMTNAGYGEIFDFDNFKIEETVGGLTITVDGELVGEPHDDDRRFVGRIIGVKVQVTLQRVAGKRGFDEPEMELLECGVKDAQDEDDPYGERYIWEKAKATAAEEMRRRARSGKTISYSDLTDRVLEPALREDYELYDFRPFEYHDVRLNHLLGEISTEEVDAGRPPLSAVVTLKEDPNRCGAEFYTLCVDLKVFIRNPSLKKQDDEFDFWARTMRELQNYWNKHNP